MWLPGKTVKLPLSGAVTSVSRYITFTASGRLVSVTRMALLRLAAVGVDVAGEHVGRGANDRLAHRELDVGAHQIEDQVEDRRPVDQVDERLVVGQQIAPIHERVPVLVGRSPGIVAALQLGRRGLEARLGAHVVEQVGEEVHFRRAERALDLQIAVDGPLLALRLGQSPGGVGQHVLLLAFASCRWKLDDYIAIGAVPGRGHEKRTIGHSPAVRLGLASRTIWQ